MNTIWLIICRLFQTVFLVVVFFGVIMLMIPTVAMIAGVLKKMMLL